MTIFTAIRGLFRRKPLTDDERAERDAKRARREAKHEQVRQAEQDILDRKMALRMGGMGIQPEHESKRDDA